MSLSLLLLLLSLLHSIQSTFQDCRPMKHLSGMVSGDVLLQVDEVQIKDISWIVNRKHIATTKPGQPVDIKALQFKNRLFNGTNGSLRVTNLTNADQGEFAANIFLMEDGKECTLLYNLTVYSKLTASDIQIDHNITWNETCSVTLTCTVRKTDSLVSWRNSVNGYVTKSTLQIMYPDVNSSWTCTAWNPATNVSKSVTPMTFCLSSKTENKHSVLIPIFVLGLLVLSITISVLVWCSRRKQQGNQTKQRWKRKFKLPTARSVPKQADYSYCEIEQLKASGLVFSM
ncbi:SLAM family member 9-like [Hyperolius riggenbachi]|uniref:SLAM family member 9-like n=1 Tax=Hyperolius riggenbachi TaxID=752182 RepID=UPI0035A26BE8